MIKFQPNITPTRRRMKRARQQHQNDSISVSESCFKDLDTHHLIADETWAPKEKGSQAGVILVDKNFKKTYVKRYEPHDYNNNELSDFIIFKLAKSCGIRTPEVKLVFTSHYAYLFSTDMNYAKSVVKKYTYGDLDKWSHSDFDMSAFIHGFFKNNQETFNIDKMATTGLLILSVMLNLTDLSAANLGIVLSETPTNKKAKIALIDFCCRDKSAFSESYSGSLKEFILNKISSKNQYLLEIGKTLSDVDYCLAFKKIESKFMAYLETAEHVIASSNNSIKQKDALTNLSLWQKNFQYLLDLAHHSKMSTVPTHI